MHWRERHPVDAVDEAFCGELGNLDGQPRLSRAAGANEGHDAMGLDQVGRDLQLTRSADKRFELDGKIHHRSPLLSADYISHAAVVERNGDAPPRTGSRPLRGRRSLAITPLPTHTTDGTRRFDRM